MVIEISAADFGDPRLLQFLREHLEDMAPTAPADSQHALDAAALRDGGGRVWVATEAGAVVGTVALTPLSGTDEELKSMRTAPARRGSGIASRLLEHALSDARQRGITTVSLETGSMDFFLPARSLYRRAGFTQCGPFGAYAEDQNSIFMTLDL